MNSLSFAIPPSRTSSCIQQVKNPGLRRLPDDRHSPYSNLAAKIAAFAAAFLLFVRFGAPPANSLDPSWTVTLAWSLAHSLQWGKDIVFTYGPLGFLHPLASPYMPTERLFIVGQILMAAGAAMIFTLALQELRRVEFWLTWFFVLSLASVLTADVLWILIPTYSLVGIHFQIKNGKPQRTSILLASTTAAYCAALWLIKASTLPLVTAWLSSAVLLLILSYRRRTALLTLATFTSASMLLWLGCRQSPLNLWSYIYRSVLIAGDYGTAMSAMPRHWWVDLGGGGIFSGSSILAAMALWNLRRDRNSVIVLIYLAVAFFLTWRAGYTRADGHTMIFIATSIALIPLFIALYGKIKIVLAVGLTLLGMTSFGMFLYLAPILIPTSLQSVILASYQNARGAIFTLADLPQLITQRDAEIDQIRQEFPLSKIRKAVGDHSIDLLGYSQCLVVFNDFAYTPRPIFQSYAAYSPALARINLTQIQARPSPAFMVIGDGPVDNHLWSMEDPLVFREILQNYRPTLVDADYLLVERRQTIIPQPEPPPTLNYLTAKLGDWVELDTNKAAVLYLDARPSFVGSIFSFLFREPYWYLEVETKDKNVHRYRLLRVAASAGFVLSPLIESPDALLLAMTSVGKPNNEVFRFRFLPMSNALIPLYGASYHYAISPVLLPKPDEDEKRLVQTIAYPGIEPTVTRSEGNIHRIIEQGTAVTFAHAPSAIHFALPAGRYRLSGEGGLQSLATTLPTCTDGDGVEFRARSSRSINDEILLHIDPIHQVAQRGFQPFSPYEFSLDEPDELIVHIDPGKNTVCDWSYFKQIHIERLSPENH